MPHKLSPALENVYLSVCDPIGQKNKEGWSSGKVWYSLRSLPEKDGKED